MTKASELKYYIIGMVNGFPPEDLKQMIIDGDVPILLEFNLPPYLLWVKDYIIKNREEILKYLTYDNVILYSGEFRPDIAVYLQHPKGKLWVERLLNQVRFIIENAELNPVQLRAKFMARVQELAMEKNKAIRLQQELEAQKELEEQQELERQKELEKQRMLEAQKLLEEQKRVEKQKRLEAKKELEAPIIKDDPIIKEEPKEEQKPQKNDKIKRPNNEFDFFYSPPI